MEQAISRLVEANGVEARVRHLLRSVREISLLHHLMCVRFRKADALTRSSGAAKAIRFKSDQSQFSMHLGIFEEAIDPRPSTRYIPLDRFDTELRCSFSGSQLLGIVSSAGS